MCNTDKVTVPGVRNTKSKKKLVMVTAYDTPTARSADAAGIDMILVGDSLGMVVLGYANTLPVTMDEVLHHLKAVRRGTERALVIADMPYGSFHLTPEETVRNAVRLLKEGGAEAVKIEGGKKRTRHVEALIEAEIPVMGHLGLTPQSVHSFGGYRVQGKNRETADFLLSEARFLADMGVFSIVLEGIPDSLADSITRGVPVPTIGIGAGPSCDGQVLVFHDLMGWSGDILPKFVRTYANLNEIVGDALKQYREDVLSGRFPSNEESYGG